MCRGLCNSSGRTESTSRAPFDSGSAPTPTSARLDGCSGLLATERWTKTEVFLTSPASIWRSYEADGLAARDPDRGWDCVSLRAVESRSRGMFEVKSTRSRISPAGLPGAVRAPLPEKLSPQLGTQSATVPAGGHWIYEIKLDGYRIMTRFEDGKATLITRRGHDWTARMAPVARDLEAFGIES